MSDAGTKPSLAYPEVRLFIDDAWRASADGGTYPIVDPATGEVIGRAARATEVDLANAAATARAAFDDWRFVPAVRKSTILRAAASLLRARAETIAKLMTLEQGKPLPEAQAEVQIAAETIEWFAEECRRIYGRTIPARDAGAQQVAVREPVGPAAVFTPWNFPLNQAARKIAAAIGAGCTVVAKPAEETPACVAELARAFQDAGLPRGVLNLVYGVPSEISTFLISHPAIRKISFTGSSVVGKQLAELAGRHMKRTTMELGGHAPVIVCADADPSSAAKIMAPAKFRNAGQICNSPTRFLVHSSIYGRFVDEFAAIAKATTVGSGLDPATKMGPLASERRLFAMEAFVQDAVKSGATLRAGGVRRGNAGFFFEPTVLADVPVTARVMSEEPFGPLALIRPFDSLDEAVAESNRLPYGLAAYAFTKAHDTIAWLSPRIEAGMIGFNGNLVAFPELPFGGVKDSGHGLEGGSEAIDAYLTTKLIRIAAA